MWLRFLFLFFCCFFFFVFYPSFLPLSRSNVTTRQKYYFFFFNFVLRVLLNQDHSDHGASKQPTNPWREWIPRFLLCTMIRVTKATGNYQTLQQMLHCLQCKYTQVCLTSTKHMLFLTFGFDLNFYPSFLPLSCLNGTNMQAIKIHVSKFCLTVLV